MADLPPVALSIRQPWAWAIIQAGKDIENRTWRTDFRGPVCIHASAGMKQSEYAEAMAFISTITNLPAPRMADLERGGIIGVAEIVGCVTTSRSPWFFGPHGFVLRNASPVDFIRVKGLLGFFDWRKHVVQEGLL
jgi:hypothetical protein